MTTLVCEATIATAQKVVSKAAPNLLAGGAVVVGAPLGAAGLTVSGAAACGSMLPTVAEAAVIAPSGALTASAASAGAGWVGSDMVSISSCKSRSIPHSSAAMLRAASSMLVPAAGAAAGSISCAGAVDSTAGSTEGIGGAGSAGGSAGAADDSNPVGGWTVNVGDIAGGGSAAGTNTAPASGATNSAAHQDGASKPCDDDATGARPGGGPRVRGV